MRDQDVLKSGLHVFITAMKRRLMGFEVNVFKELERRLNVILEVPPVHERLTAKKIKS